MTKDRLAYFRKTLAKSLQALPDDFRFRLSHRHSALAPLPPPWLRYRVAGHYSIEQFHVGGEESLNAWRKSLAVCGETIEQFSRILDFGVGCGRIMRWMRPYAQGRELFGIDVDDWAVAWSRRHLPFAAITRNAPLPPTDFPDNFFDLVYSHSVFTHLDEPYQDAWLKEFSRICRPGGRLLLTVHGDRSWQTYWNSAPDHPAMIERRALFEKQRFLFVREDEWRGVFPDFYHSMFHTKEYVADHWSKFLNVDHYLEGAMLKFQDIVALSNRKA